MSVIQGNLLTPTAEAVEGGLNDIAQITMTALARQQVLLGVAPTTLAKQSVSIQNDPSSTGTLYVGSSLVTNTRCLAALVAGAAVSVPLQDASQVYLYSTLTGIKANVGWV